MKHALLALAATFLLAACGSLPEKPMRPTLYDFGPGALSNASTPGPYTQPPLVLAEVDASASFDGAAILYRLGYADAHQLRPYAMARWSAPPALIVRQRLREQLGKERLVLDSEEAAALERSNGRKPRVLRVELEEFTHYFETADKSLGLIRLRVTLLDNTPGGERLVGQRVISMQRPAPSADAAGGVRALAEVTDAMGVELAAWLRQQR
jgi:cholesterol transport system auxiliary component